ncbi:MAG: tRNA preQ1(34) S-adenosylmethionine ribosyltransferase-isomerase QueA [Thermodesulfobacteriota bacterium]
MKTCLLDYDLPPELVAQRPVPRRRDARLMVLSRPTGKTADRVFSDLPSLLRKGDLLVVNDTRVLRGRLRAVRKGGGAVEILLLSPSGAAGGGGERWEALARPSKRLKEGDVFDIGGLTVRLERYRGGGKWEVALAAAGGSLLELLERVGEVPLPPYIRRAVGDPAAEEDKVRYQTVYAEHSGSVAAPTAGLHFDEEMLRQISAAGIGIARVTLSVGYGTFSPIRTDEVEEYEIHPEHYRMPPETAEAVNAARAEGGRIVAVGTTSVRTLETCAAEDGRVAPSEGTTRLFLFPGRPFRVVDAMVTNFHLPRSSLLALVMAFAGVDAVRAAYREAVERRYRFYSYGDAMFIW